MTAPSTMMPKSMAPRLIRLALIWFSHHAGDGEQHGQRNDAGRDEGRPEVAQDQEQDDDDQQRAFEQVLLDRPDRGLDQLGAVVDRRAPRRRRAASARSRPACAATRCAAVRLFSPISSMAVPITVSLPSSVAAPVRRSVPSLTSATSRDADRHAAARADDDVADLLDVVDLPRRAHEILLAVALDVARADIGVVRRQRRHDVAEA